MPLSFKDLDLSALQAVVYPVVEILSGVDIGEKISLQADTAFAIRDCLNEAAEIFDVAGMAMEDGRITNDEISAIIDEATDMPEAARNIVEAMKDND